MPLPSAATGPTGSTPIRADPGIAFIEWVAPQAVGLPGILRRGAIPAEGVLPIRRRPQMVRSYTARIVTKVVIEAEVVGQCAVHKLVRNAVGAESSTDAPTGIPHPIETVAIPVFRAGPEPASPFPDRAVYARPEALSLIRGEDALHVQVGSLLSVRGHRQHGSSLLLDGRMDR